MYVVRAPIPGTIAWQDVKIDVLEEQGAFILTVQRFGLAQGPVTFSYSTAGGKAVTGIDYGTEDGDKTFFVDLTSATNGAALVRPKRVSVRIRDDEDVLVADGFER